MFLSVCSPASLPANVELAGNIFVHPPGNRDPSRIGQRLQPRRDIDPVAIDFLAIDDDLALIDADAELQTARCRDIGVAGSHQLLNGFSAADSSTTLANSARMLSPAVLMTRPPCSAITGKTAA